MSSANMRLILSLTGRDEGAIRLLKETERQLERAALSKGKLARANKPYETAGIRSERQIQREIMQTEASFRRLARSGVASQNDLQRAAVATKNRIKELNAELNQGIGLQSRFGKGMALGGAALAGGVAAYGILKPAMDNQKQLDANITQVAWQAYGEDNNKSVDWIATKGKEQIKALTLELVQKNGGTADAALQLINSMMANGMSFEQTKSSAQTSHKAMIASSEGVGQYNPQDTAKLMKVLNDFGFKGNDLGKAFEYAMKSGMQGNFEIGDMVRELPALLPAAKSAGMDGLNGLAFVLSSLQSGANKAGSNSEAANNFRNLLEKTLSPDTVKRLSKMENPNAKGKGIDWKASVLKGKENGESAVQVLSKLANKMLENDSEYKNYEKKANAGDKTAESQMNIMKGFVLSSLLPDIQAKGGLLAASDAAQIQEYMQGLAGLKPGDSLVDKKNAVLQQSRAYQDEKADSERMLKQDLTSFEEAETNLKKLSAEYPNATLALQTMTAAATAAAGALGLMALSNGGVGGIGAGAKGAFGLLSRFGMVGVGAAAGGFGLLDANDTINKNEGKRFFEGGWNSRASGYGESAASGALMGAAIGSVVPVIGTAIGAAIGGSGGLLAAIIADAIKDKPTNDAKNVKPARVAPLAPAEPLSPINRLNREAPTTSIVQVERNKPVMPSVIAPVVAQNNTKPAEPPEKLTPVITQQTATYQNALMMQTAAYQASLAADTAAVTGGLNMLNSTIAGANQTINNNMTVNLDGRVIANEVSRYQVSMFGRGAGQ